MMTERERKLAFITDWPDKPLEDNMCLHCGIAKRSRHSWFCREECEDVYVGQKS